MPHDIHCGQHPGYQGSLSHIVCYDCGTAALDGVPTLAELEASLGANLARATGYDLSWLNSGEDD